MKASKYSLVLLTVLSHGLNSLLALIFFYFSVRFLSAEDFGELRTAMVVLPLLMAGTLSGYDSVILKNTNLGVPPSLLKIFFIRSLLGLLVGAIILSTLIIFNSSISDTLLYFLVIIAFTLPLFETTTGYKNYLLATYLKKKGVILFTFVKFFSLLLFLIGISILYFLDNKKLVLLFFMLSISIPSFFAFILVALKQVKSDRKKNNNKVRPFAAQSAFSVTISMLFYTFAYSIDKLYVRYELGAEALALFSVLLMVPIELAKLGDILIPLYYKKLFINVSSKRDWLKSGFVFLGGAIVMMLIYSLLFYSLSDEIFGDEYNYDYTVVLLSSIIVFSMTYEYFSNHKVLVRFGAKGLLIYSFIGVVVLIVCIPLGVGWYDLNGLFAVLFLKQTVVPYYYVKFKERKNARASGF